MTGKRITAEALAGSINTDGYAQYEMSRFLALGRHTPPLLRGTHAMAVMNAYAYAD